ncbi:MAG: hypothetical protein ABJG68_10600 [Crocinitomicaceae bacterium]
MTQWKGFLGILTIICLTACSISEYYNSIPPIPENYYTLALEDSYDTTWVDKEYSFICGLKGSDSVEFSQYPAYSRTVLFGYAYEKEFYDSTGQRYSEVWYYRKRKLIKIKYYYYVPFESAEYSSAWNVYYAGTLKLKELDKEIYLNGRK